MKYFFFFLAGLVIVALGVVARTSPRFRPHLCFALGFCPVLTLSINFVSNEFYRGASRGFEVTIVDLVAVAVLVAVPVRRGVGTFPLLAQSMLYLSVALTSTILSEVPLYSGFGTWKIFRGIFLAWVGFRVATESIYFSAALRGLVWSIIYCGLSALVDRYYYGLLQVVGPFPHPNGLAMFANLVFPITFVRLLAGSKDKADLAAAALAPLSVVLSLSRAGLALFVGSAAMTFVLSTFQTLSKRKLQLLILGILSLTAVGIKAGDTIVERFTTAPEKSAEARTEFEEVGELMAHDYPLLGVGPNLYSYQSESRGYGAAVGLADMDRGGVMHNIYQLTRAEMGYLGYFSFMLLFFSPLLLGGIRLIRKKDPQDRSAMLGLLVGYAITLVHGNLEWSLHSAQLGSGFWLITGLIAGLSKGRPQGWTG